MSGNMAFDKKQIEARTWECTTDELAVAIGVRHEAAVIVTINANHPDRDQLPVQVAVVGLGIVESAEKRVEVLKMARGAIDLMIREAGA